MFTLKKPLVLEIVIPNGIYHSQILTFGHLALRGLVPCPWVGATWGVGGTLFVGKERYFLIGFLGFMPWHQPNELLLQWDLVEWLIIFAELAFEKCLKHDKV